jgi:DNA-binding response OmpR family regulator
MLSRYPSHSTAIRPQILCVDDDDQTLQLRRQVLEAQGYCVLSIQKPLEALRCDLSIVQLAVVDFEMPDLNGLQLLLRLRAARASFPIVLVSGRSDELEREVRRLFHACISKAEPVHRLLDVIRSYLTAAPDPPQCPEEFLHRLRLNILRSRSITSR